MRERLVVIRDRRGVDRNADRARDLQPIVSLRQLPQPAEQAVRVAPREHDLVAGLQPQRSAREHGQLVGLLALRDHRQLVLAAFARGDAHRR